MVPSAWAMRVRRVRCWYRNAVLRMFTEVDTPLIRAAPLVAPRIGQRTCTLNGPEGPLRPNIAIDTQPISYISLPIVAVPVPQPDDSPTAVRITTAPWREDAALRVAHDLPTHGKVRPTQPLE